MKRFISVSIVLLSVYSVFAYEDTDITTANSLASYNIIVDQSQAPEQYRLDDKILRQEVIGMALKIQGITPPESYTCKGYYSDTKQNDWVCRAIEIAADNGVITRGNKKANPEKYVTRAEALAMLLNAGELAGELTEDDPPFFDLEIPIIFDNTNAWQQAIIEKASVRTGLSIIRAKTEDKKGETIHVQFRPNDEATRAEIFGFASKIFRAKTYTTYSRLFEYQVTYEKGMKVTENNDMISFSDKDAIYTISKQKRTCEAPCGDGYYNALQFDGKGVTNSNTQYTDEGFFSEIMVEGKSGKSRGFSRTIFLPDVAYNIKAITKEENYDAQAIRLKRFIESIDFYGGTPAEQEQKRNWKILRSYLAIQLKTIAADPEEATVETCFQILDGVPGTDSYSVYEIHNAICGGDPQTSPYYGDFYIGGQRVYKNEFTPDGEDDWVMVD